MDTSTKNIVHNQKSHRFEMTVQGYIAVLDYIMTDKTITFTHTGVPPAIENRGVGSRLVKAGLEYAKTHELTVKSYCWFVSKYIRKHQDYQELE